MLTQAPDVELAGVGIIALGVRQVVVRPPGDARGLIGDARELLARLLRGDVPHQSRPRDQTAGQIRQRDAGVVGDDAHRSVGLAQHQPADGRQQRAGESLHVLAAGLLDADLAVDELLQQLVGADQVELEVLLDHARAVRDR